ncbi:MAG: aspartate aminotransferase family protein [Rikenellaceae bacterium]|nr:aspartate aminotransferase family protein [Rikenellaceae bacterium]
MKPLRQLFLEHVGQTSANPLAVEIERAEGIYLYGPDGKRYTDLISGVSVSNVGHGNPQVVEAVCAQARKYMHLMVYGELVESPQVLYARRIVAHLPDSLQSVYFVNSGSEAVEGALKLAKRATGRTQLIGFENAYHGSTHGALSVMGGEYFRAAFRPLLPDVGQIRFNCLQDLEQITERTAGVIIEPMQGEAGIVTADASYLKALRDRCTETGALLIFDEIQTGFGRTGYWFAFQKLGVVPDILVLAKSLGGGMPLGAFISSRERMSVLQTDPPLGHITTFGGHPVSCAAGLAALEFLESSGLVEQAEQKGALFESLLCGHPCIREIRRCGLILGVEIGNENTVQRLIRDFVHKGLLPDTFLWRETAFRIAPPLIIREAEIRETAEVILACLDRLA